MIFAFRVEWSGDSSIIPELYDRIWSSIVDSISSYKALRLRFSVCQAYEISSFYLNSILINQNACITDRSCEKCLTNIGTKVPEDRCKDILSSMGLLHRIYDRSCSGRAFQINRIVSLFGTSSIAWPFGQLSPRISDSSVFLVWSFSASVNLDLMIKPVSKNVFFRFWRWDIYAPRIAVVPSWKLVSSLPSLMEGTVNSIFKDSRSLHMIESQSVLAQSFPFCPLITLELRRLGKLRDVSN